jgi:N4-gp56 family major capsid protein
LANDTATTNFSSTVVTLVSKGVAENLRNNLIWLQEGSFLTAKIVAGTNQARYVAYGDLTVDASAVTTEGTANAPEEFAIGYQTLTVAQKMRSVRLTDVVMDESPHDLAMVAAERIAFNAAAVADFVTATAAEAVAATNFADQVANRAALTTGGVLNGDEVKRIVAELKSNNVPTFADGTYHAIVSPLAVYDLQSDTAVGGWIETSKYAASTQLLTGELGKYAGVRFIESNLGTQPDSTGGVGDAFPIYRTYFFGPEWFAFGDLQSIKSYVVTPGGDHTDPAAQAALVSWKGMYGVEILGDDVEGTYLTVTGGSLKYRVLESIGTLTY